MRCIRCTLKDLIPLISVFAIGCLCLVTLSACGATIATPEVTTDWCVNGCAYLVISNMTFSDLRLSLFGPTSRYEIVTPGQHPDMLAGEGGQLDTRATMEGQWPFAYLILPGEYRVEVSARCGKSTQTFTVAEYDRQRLSYTCQKK
jgi:hypothetical protein